MCLVRAVLPALAEVTATRYAELTHAFIAQLPEERVQGIHAPDIFHHGHDVNDGFGSQTGHCRATDVVDVHQFFAQHLADACRLLVKHLLPQRIIRNDFHFHPLPLLQQILVTETSKISD